MTIDELYGQAVAGDREAENRMFERLAERFRLIAHHKIWNKVEAEDLVQTALSVVAAEYKKLEIDESFVAWAHKVLDNRVLGYIQKQKRQKGKLTSLESTVFVTGGWTPDPALKMQLLACLNSVARANRRYARIINLHYQGFSREEVCRKLDVSAQQSYVVLSRARAMLRKCLDEGEKQQ